MKLPCSDKCKDAGVIVDKNEIFTCTFTLELNECDELVISDMLDNSLNADEPDCIYNMTQK